MPPRDLTDHDLLISVNTRLKTVERVMWGILGAVGLAALGFLVDILHNIPLHGAT